VTPARETKPVVDFDHTSHEYARDGDAITADLRERCPVAYSEHHGGFWLLTGYEAASRAMRDEARFSSRHEAPDPDGFHLAGVNIPEAPQENALIEQDPPEWNPIRRLLNPIFAPPAVEKLRSEFVAFTAACIDKKIESGEIDFVLDIANPVPAQATLAFLGLPLDEWESYAEPCHEVVYTRPGTPEFAKAVEGQQGMFQALAREVAARRAHPRDDNLTYIVQSDAGGRQMTDEEIVSLCGTIINGGVDTTTALVANAVEYLDRNHDLRRELVEAPERIPLAAEEFLRYFSPVQSFARTVVDETELGGQHLHRGDRVLVCFGAANRDESEFPNADEFVADRTPNRHMSFGLGKHRCIGSTFARTEFVVMLEQILARMPDYVIDRDRTEAYPSHGIVRGYIQMPATFTPGPGSD
jgi:cytochrome P450